MTDLYKFAQDMQSDLNKSLEPFEKGLNDLFSSIEKVLPQEPEVISQAKYDELIQWFVDQPKPPEFQSAVIARKYGKDKKIVILQLFLDQNKKIITKYQNIQYGRKLISVSLDSDLKEAFGTKNVIIVS